jgi:hypothetical protein
MIILPSAEVLIYKRYFIGYKVTVVKLVKNIFYDQNIFFVSIPFPEIDISDPNPPVYRNLDAPTTRSVTGLNPVSIVLSLNTCAGAILEITVSSNVTTRSGFIWFISIARWTSLGDERTI